jgi:hypothetical protein
VKPYERCPRWPALILAGAIVGAALGAGEADVLEQNRRLLDRWRADPEHHARLLRDLRAFYALPRPRQQQLRQLDQDLYATDPATQARLMAVLERYNAWLDSLADDQRRYVLDAPDAATRLARIRDQRLREWLPRLPTREQEAVGRLPADQQPDRIATFRSEERRQRTVWLRDWQTRLAAIPKPAKMSELPPAARAFVEAHVTRHLTSAERKSLAEAEGKYPDWLRQLLALSEKHPVLPPGPMGEITTLEELKKVKGAEKLADRLLTKKPKGSTKQVKGRWPEFALMVRNLPASKNFAFPALGASQPSEFPKEVQVFLNRELLPGLSNERKTQLEKAKGKWPEYPYMLHEIARQRRLVIPGMSLPGPVEMWESVRAPTSP